MTSIRQTGRDLPKMSSDVLRAGNDVKCAEEYVLETFHSHTCVNEQRTIKHSENLNNLTFNCNMYKS